MTKVESFPSNVPILLLGYNRPEHLINRFQELAAQETGHLTISIDGEGMTLRELTEVRTAAEKILVGKEYEIKAHSINLGLCDHIVGAISLILKTNSHVIVIEDDISVGPNFYKNMLNGIELSLRHPGIAAVSAFSAIGKSRLNFNAVRWRKTRYFSCWGWAVSKEIWDKYDLYIRDFEIKQMLSNSLTWRSLSQHQKAVWYGRFSRVSESPNSTWDIQFQFMCFRHDFRNLAPTRRFSDNKGFNDIRSEHTSGKMPRWMKLSQRYDGVIPAKKTVWIERLYQIVIDENTIAGDSWLTAQIRNFRKRLA